MNDQVEKQYLTWLYSQVGSTRARDASKTHWSLMEQLFEKEFTWFIPNDDNRVEDGRDLRNEFLSSNGVEGLSPEDSRGCTVLEMLVGLSRRVAFDAEGQPKWWFWHLLDNLGISHVTDEIYSRRNAGMIDDILDQLIWRTYDPNGAGGLFPLEHANEDQRDVEVWFQLQAYLLERG